MIVVRPSPRKYGHSRFELRIMNSPQRFLNTIECPSSIRPDWKNRSRGDLIQNYLRGSVDKEVARAALLIRIIFLLYENFT
jgi:hypothetical protein